MSVRVRAISALVLLSGFFLIGVVLLAVMATVDWLLLTRFLVAQAAWLEATLVTSTVLAAVVIVQGLVTFLRAGRLRPVPDAVPVGPDEEPELWQAVREAADAAGERAPDELLLTAEVNAGVAEQSRLLGLLPGRRRLLLGLPLLAGLTLPQLRSVLAHEFGHYGNRDTRLGGVTMRGRTAVLHTVQMFQQGSIGLHAVIGSLYVAYARVFLRSSQSVARAQEFAADRAAARYAGRTATASALRTIPVVDTAYDHYLTTYAELGARCGALPPRGEFYGGFRHLLAARTGDRLAALGAQRRPERPHPYDSHPPMAERVARIEELPEESIEESIGEAIDESAEGLAGELAEESMDGERRDEAGASPSGLSLLRDADAAFAALEARALPAEVAGSQRMSWDGLALSRSVADAREWAEPLRTATGRALHPASRQTRTEPGLAEVLDAFDDGLLWGDIADRMPRPYQAGRLTGASARNFIRPALFDGLAGLALLHLVECGAATPDIAWSGTPGLALPAHWEAGMDAAVDAAIADEPDTAPLRALLAQQAAVS